MKVHYLILLLKCIVLCIYLIISFSVVETQDMLLGSTILLSDDFSESEVDSWCTITDSTNMVVGRFICWLLSLVMKLGVAVIVVIHLP